MAKTAIHPGEHLAKELNELGVSAEFWLNLQILYELRLARKKVARSIEALPTLKPSERVSA